MSYKRQSLSISSLSSDSSGPYFFLKELSDSATDISPPQSPPTGCEDHSLGDLGLQRSYCSSLFSSSILNPGPTPKLSTYLRSLSKDKEDFAYEFTSLDNHEEDLGYETDCEGPAPGRMRRNHVKRTVRLKHGANKRTTLRPQFQAASSYTSDNLRGLGLHISDDVEPLVFPAKPKLSAASLLNSPSPIIPLSSALLPSGSKPFDESIISTERLLSPSWSHFVVIDLGTPPVASASSLATVTPLTAFKLDFETAVLVQEHQVVKKSSSACGASTASRWNPFPSLVSDAEHINNELESFPCPDSGSPLLKFPESTNDLESSSTTSPTLLDTSTGSKLPAVVNVNNSPDSSLASIPSLRTSKRPTGLGHGLPSALRSSAAGSRRDSVPLFIRPTYRRLSSPHQHLQSHRYSDRDLSPIPESPSFTPPQTSIETYSSSSRIEIAMVPRVKNTYQISSSTDTQTTDRNQAVKISRKISQTQSRPWFSIKSPSFPKNALFLRGCMSTKEGAKARKMVEPQFENEMKFFRYNGTGPMLF